MSVPRDAVYDCIHCQTPTRYPDGVCQFCRPHPASDRLLEQYAPKVHVRFPLDPSTHLPCMDHKELFGREDTWNTAREVCGTCPAAAREWCLENAIANDYKGTYGGTSTKERQKIKRERMREKEESEVEEIDPDELCTKHACRHGYEVQCTAGCLTHREHDLVRKHQRK